jgi:hypothetical protein
MFHSAAQQDFAGPSQQGLPRPESPARRDAGADEVLSPAALPDPTNYPMNTRTRESVARGPEMPHAGPRMNRLAELVHTEATVLRQFRPGVLTAVVRPDEGSEIRLELRLVRGQVEARAHVERGDAVAFAGGWTELQQSLKAQGIVLLPLGSPVEHRPAGSDAASAQSAPAGQGSSGQGREGGGHREPQGRWPLAGLPEILQPAVSGLTGKWTGKTGGTRHLLESWA